MDGNFVLHWPLLLLLLPIPLLIRQLSNRRAPDQQPSLFFPALDTLASLQKEQGALSRTPEVSPWWLWLVWLLLVLAATRPQWQGQPIDIPTSGRDLLLVVDISPSMQIEDMVLKGESEQRIDAIKDVVGNFIKHREGDRLGLVLFGSQAYLQTPLTFDHITLQQQLSEAQPGFAGDQTAIGDAIALSAKRLEGNEQKKRVIILLTDGANNTGALSPLQGAEVAKDLGIKIYTIGIGADEMTRRTFFGVQTINPSEDLDEGTLTTIATETGGHYYRARNTEQLQKIYQELDKLEPVAGKQETLRPITEWFYWPLSVALLITFLSTAFAVLKRQHGGLHA